MQLNHHWHRADKIDNSAAKTAPQITLATKVHSENMRVWQEYTNIQEAVKKLILETVEDKYQRAIKDSNTGYAAMTAMQMIQHLY